MGSILVYIVKSDSNERGGGVTREANQTKADKRETMAFRGGPPPPMAPPPGQNPQLRVSIFLAFNKGNSNSSKYSSSLSL